MIPLTIEMAIDKRLCFVCEASSELSEDEPMSMPWDKDQQSSYLKCQLSVILLVRKILNIPLNVIEHILITKKGDPASWGLRMCGRCKRIFMEAEFLHFRIVELNRDFENLAGRLRSLLKRTQGNGDHDDEETNENTVSLFGVTTQNGRRRRKAKSVNRTRNGINMTLKKKAKDEENIHSLSSFGSVTIQTTFAKPTVRTDLNTESESDDINPSKVGELDRLELLTSGHEQVPAHDYDCDEFKLEEGSENEDDVKETWSSCDYNDDIGCKFGSKDNDNDDENREDSVPESPSDQGIDKASQPSSTRKRIDVFSIPQPIKRKGFWCCPLCKIKRLDKCSMHGHVLRVHFNDQFPFHCHACPRQFMRECSLRRHYVLSHGGMKSPLDEMNCDASFKKLECDLCTPDMMDVSKYENLEALEVHRRGFHFGIEKPHECALCPSTFKLRDELRAHLLSHRMDVVQRLRISCSECHEVFWSTKTLQLHLKAKGHTSQFPFQCKICNVGFYYKRHLKRHNLYADHQTESESGPRKKSRLFCSQCHERFPSTNTLKIHLKTKGHTTKPPFSCGICGLGFYYERLLKKHKRNAGHNSEEGMKPPRIFCSQCDETFPSTNTLKIHLKTEGHTSQLPFQCEVCGLGFYYERLLKKHKRNNSCLKNTSAIEIGDERHYCSVCDIEFKSLKEMKLHIRLNKCNIPSPHQCELCPKTFKAPIDLENHQMQEHHEELNLQPNKCKFCDKILTSKRNLDFHIRRLHTKETKFKCEKCDMGFMFIREYRRHYAVAHEKQKEFLCTHCPKKFGQLQLLTVHMRVHTGEKPYQCKECGKEFSDQPTFKRHLETHGDQVHVCSHCSKEFKVWHSFRLHMKSVHKEVIYQNPVVRAAQGESPESSVLAGPGPSHIDLPTEAK